MAGEQKVTGGVCVRDTLMGPKAEPHYSTGRDIDASRFCAVHICDRCKGLFVPDSKESG